MLIADMGRVPLLVAGGFLLAATVWYFLYVRWRIQRESAVVYMVRSLLSLDFGRTNLEDELVQISLEREGHPADRFDELVRDAAILDLGEQVTARQCFRLVADVLAPRLGMEAGTILELFLERERQSSTVIHPGLAIPHIIVPGTGVFHLALVRSRSGIVFSELHPPVRAAFVLVGSMDERNLHLKALVAVAHITQDPEFEERWMKAQNAEQLRDVVRLARRRHHRRADGPGPAGGDGTRPGGAG